MYADDLAWTLKDWSDDEVVNIPKPTLMEYEKILHTPRPLFNSDLAELQITRLIRLVNEGLQK